MIDKQMPVIMIIMKDHVYTVSITLLCIASVITCSQLYSQKCINALEQVSARAVSLLLS